MGFTTLFPLCGSSVYLAISEKFEVIKRIPAFNIFIKQGRSETTIHELSITFRMKLL